MGPIMDIQFQNEIYKCHKISLKYKSMLSEYIISCAEVKEKGNISRFFHNWQTSLYLHRIFEMTTFIVIRN